MQHDDKIDIQCRYSRWATLIVSNQHQHFYFERSRASLSCGLWAGILPKASQRQKRTQICIYQHRRGLEVLLQLSLAGALSKKINSLESIHLRVFYLWVLTWVFQGYFEYQCVLPCFQCKWQACWRDKTNDCLPAPTRILLQLIAHRLMGREKGTSTSFSCQRSGLKFDAENTFVIFIYFWVKHREDESLQSSSSDLSPKMATESSNTTDQKLSCSCLRALQQPHLSSCLLKQRWADR